MQKHVFRRAGCRLLGAALLVAALPLAAHAQLGALKRLKNRVSPDSATKAAAAAARDSGATRDTAATAGLPTSASGVKGAALAKVGEKAAGAAGGDSTSKRSKLARVASKAVSASQKFEDVTGLSVKDAALIATGAGVGAVAAKKLGVDPTSMSTKAMSRASERNAASQQASMAGMPNMAAMAGAPRPTGASGRSAQMAWPTSGGRTMPAGAPYSDADMKTMQAFQEEMMRVSMAASRGDADAEARLQRLQEISARYQPEMERLSLRGTAADTAAVRRLVNIQVEIMREWLKDSPASVKAVGRVSKPAKVGRP